jgi:hypothetical protein
MVVSLQRWFYAPGLFQLQPAKGQFGQLASSATAQAKRSLRKVYAVLQPWAVLRVEEEPGLASYL